MTRRTPLSAQDRAAHPSLPAPDDCGCTERAQVAEDDGIVRAAPGGTRRTFTAGLAGRPPRGKRPCRMWRRRQVGKIANAAAGAWVAG